MLQVGPCPGVATALQSHAPHMLWQGSDCLWPCSVSPGPLDRLGAAQEYSGQHFSVEGLPLSPELPPGAPFCSDSI